MLQQGTIHIARRHALQLIEIERRWHIFWEIPIQQFFLKHPMMMMWINWLYSFIHIPGTIAFLVWLYYYLITRNRLLQKQLGVLQGNVEGSPASPALYEARRRTMAVCNLLAFVVFTVWPCMPPRLLSDTSIEGPDGVIAKSFGFVDTVHGKVGARSVWTENRFCNQYGKFGLPIVVTHQDLNVCPNRCSLHMVALKSLLHWNTSVLVTQFALSL